MTRSPFFRLSFAITAMMWFCQPAQADHLDYRDDLPFIRLEGIERICFSQPPRGQREATTFAFGIPETDFPNDVAIALVGQGQPQLALDIVDRFVPGRYEQFDQARSVALALATNGYPDAALELLQRVEGEDVIGDRYQDNAAFPVVFALTAAGQGEAALAAAMLIEEENHRGEAIAHLVTHFIQTNEVEQAIALIESVDTPFYRVAALACAGVALTEQQQSERADRLFQQAIQLAQQGFNQAQEPDEPFAASEAVGAVILGLAEIGAVDQSRQILESLQPEAEQARRYLPILKSTFLVPLLQSAQATAGSDTVHQLLIDIPHSPEDWSWFGLPAVWLGFAAHQNFSEAQYQALLNQLETHLAPSDTAPRGLILGAAAVELAEQQAFAPAVAAYEESMQRFAADDEGAYGIWRVRNFLAIATAMKLAGDTEAAWAFIEQYASAPGTAIANLGVVTGLACHSAAFGCGRYASLEIDLTALTSWHWLDLYYILQLQQFPARENLTDAPVLTSPIALAKAVVLTEVAKTQISSGDYEAGLVTAAELAGIARETVAVNWAQQEITLAFAAAHQFDTAIAFAEQISDPHTQSTVLLSISTGLITSGAYDQALSILQGLSLSSADQGFLLLQQQSMLAALAAAVAQAERFEQALSIAQMIEREYFQDTALRAIAAAWAQSGQADQALALTEQIDTPSEKVAALSHIAIALIQAGQIDQGLTVLEQAFAVTPNN
ncbi:MAG: hypothetical protein AAFO87_09425 [Cyanobacteria bacterium J06607_6]